MRLARLYLQQKRNKRVGPKPRSQEVKPQNKPADLMVLVTHFDSLLEAGLDSEADALAEQIQCLDAKQNLTPTKRRRKAKGSKCNG